jgi:alpha-L-rhamnosidase
MTTRVTHLRCEYQYVPIGIDVVAPRLSWMLQSDEQNVEQAAYQILVADTAKALDGDEGNCWDSGVVHQPQSIHQVYVGRKLITGQRYYWKVRAWLTDGGLTAWSEQSYWEMGLLSKEDWRAKWITADSFRANDETRCPMMRKRFQITQDFNSARVYVTALGLYELWLNGERVGDAFFTPGWTSYGKRLQYQTYDVTNLLKKGDNVIAAILGDGWYRGRLGWEGRSNVYGDKRGLLLQLELRGRQGSIDTLIMSDKSWKTADSPIMRSGIYEGETYDARQEMIGWTKPGFDESGWVNVAAMNPPPVELVAPVGPPVRMVEILKPTAIMTSPNGETIFDFGQNMVGQVRLHVSGEVGVAVTLRHGEVLDPQGNLYCDNLRSAAQKVEYILKGEGDEIYQPRFTFQGFRYVSIEGFPGTLTLEDLSGVVMHSDVAQSGDFICSHQKVNKLYRNILWSQKGNSLDVPTDCPQRDERLGWTGDAQVFFRTAAFNMDVAGFFTKWLFDLAVDQRSDGSVPHVVPDFLPEAGSSGWGDAATMIPWAMYEMYGDTRILELQYESMQSWVDYIWRQAGENKIWDSGFHFGDWLAGFAPHPLFPSPVTNIELIATAFFAHSADILARTATILNKEEDAEEYGDLRDAIKDAFNHEFVSPSGRIGPNTQAAYILALMFDLLPQAERKETADRLVELIRKNNNHLSTGFLSTPYVCLVLTRFGYPEIAYDLLMQESPPSWLYAVDHGATTIWEHWASIKPDGSFEDMRMNSFNHYANGSIGEWIYQTIAGIQPAAPGFKRILIKPQPGGGLTYAKARYQSMYGEICSAWQIEEGKFTLEIGVPANTRAVVQMPDGSETVEVGSGTHQFKSLVTAI